MKNSIITAVCAAAVSLTGIVSAQEKKRKAAQPVQPRAAEQSAADTKPDEATIAQLGKIMPHVLDSVYVSPEIGSRLARQLQEKFAAGGYANAASSSALAEMLTNDLRAWADDRHLYVRHTSAADAATGILTVEEWEKQKSSHFQAGAGGRVRVLVPPGAGLVAPPPQQSGPAFDAKMLNDGVGYLKLGVFGGGEAAREKLAESMNTLAASQALIIDLRDCPGGSADMVSFLASYFFDPEPRVLMNRYFRPTGERVASMTVSDLPGKRMPETDLYILTSPRTASAGESFAYTLQQYGRAKVVGETTAGAGYNNAIIPLGKGFVFSVSYGRPEHPRSGKGWEAVGVQPDVKVNADEALEAAQKLAARR